METEEIWEIGNSLGLLGKDNREDVVQQFDEWEKRDGETVKGKGVDEVLESTMVVNADC